MEYEFTLKYKLSNIDCNAGDIVKRLADAGCDDALVGTGTAGRIALTFTRSAESSQAAVLSALSDVKRVIPTAKLIEADSGFQRIQEVIREMQELPTIDDRPMGAILYNADGMPK